MTLEQVPGKRAFQSAFQVCLGQCSRYFSLMPGSSIAFGLSLYNLEPRSHSHYKISPNQFPIITNWKKKLLNLWHCSNCYFTLLNNKAILWSCSINAANSLYVDLTSAFAYCL